MTKRSMARCGAAALVAALVAAACTYVYPPFSIRSDGPVVMTGADLPTGALGRPVDQVALYRWSDQWVQVSIQVDERFVVDFGAYPMVNGEPGTVGTVYGTEPIGQTTLQYADPTTWVGPDPDPTLDADDELVFMAADAGAEAPADTEPPTGVGPGVKLALTDPLTDNVGYMYLFATDTVSDASGGSDYVDYAFSPTGGNYLTDYKRADGPNPELSGVVTPAYQLGFIDRWFHTSLVLANGSGGDVLDGQKYRFNFDTCTRSNRTFADAEGAFVANIDGPVRAIRSYVGANSGPLTQQTVIMYRDRFEIITEPWVHSIPGVVDVMDWYFGPGTVYGSSTLDQPELLDGNLSSTPDSTLPEWEYFAGPQGVATLAAQLTTTIDSLETGSVLFDRPATPTPHGLHPSRGNGEPIVTPFLRLVSKGK